MSQFKCVIFVEGELEETVTCNSFEELKGLMKGVEKGAGFYGAGSCQACDLADLNEMLEDAPEEAEYPTQKTKQDVRDAIKTLQEA